MIPRMTIAVSVALFLLLGSSDLEARVVPKDFQRLDSALGEILQELARLEGVSENASATTCRRMHRDIANLRQRVSEVQVELRELTGASTSGSVGDSRSGRSERRSSRSGRIPVIVVEVPAPEPGPVLPEPISDHDLSKLIQSIESESFAAGKLRVLENTADYAWVTTAQVMKLLELFVFSGDKLNALGILAGKVIDLENAFEIYAGFTFDSDKEKAREIIRAHR